MVIAPNDAIDPIVIGRMRVRRVVPKVKVLCGANRAVRAAGTSGSGVQLRHGSAQRERQSDRSGARSVRMEIVRPGHAATREHGDPRVEDLDAAMHEDPHATPRGVPDRGRRAASNRVESADLHAGPKAGRSVDQKEDLKVGLKADPKADPKAEPSASASRAWASPERVRRAMANPASAGRAGAKADSKSRALASPAFANPVQAGQPQAGAVQARGVRMAPFGSSGPGQRP